MIYSIIYLAIGLMVFIIVFIVESKANAEPFQLSLVTGALWPVLVIVGICFIVHEYYKALRSFSKVKKGNIR